MKKPLLILTGPTAVGKTSLSIRLAKKINGAIISADSMQIYRYMDIGSAKIRPSEMDGVPHYLVDVLDPSEEFNVFRFQKMAKEAMEEIYRAGQIPILVGGTGFYIQALLKDVAFDEDTGESRYRKELEALAEERGSGFLHEMLQTVDPSSAAAIHPNNIKRVIRALEYYQETGSRISEHNHTQKEKPSPYCYAYFVLNDERALLYERINQRVDQMMEQGLLMEVTQLKNMGYHKGLVSMQGLGYKEILSYLDGAYTLVEAVEVIKRDTRHFAKRQLTWFRREPDVIWVDKPFFNYQEDQILDYILQRWEERRKEDKDE
ncbi:MAG: tRNA (adenosine(37)-N6)-dimethylallyltransferase MiaA [Lachnospiraceae bacterium]|nr:tRNA (adenosine(37)-N6)-dimethylallyltransferase MiaA [Lachnospiraceae bacterium]